MSGANSSLGSSTLTRSITFALLCLPALAHGTNGYFSHGYGVKAEGIAGVGIALAQDSLTLAANPAGLTAVPDTFDLSATAFQPDRGATLVQGGQSTRYSGNDTKTFLIPALGYVRRVSDRLTIGVAIYGNGGMNTDYARNPFERFGARGRTGVDLSQAFISPGIALKISERQSIGLTINAAYQRFEGKGVGLFAGFSATPAAVSDRGHDSGSGVGVRLGWQGQVTDKLTLGATWQSRINTDTFSKYAGLFADQGGFDIPSSWGVGADYRISDRWRVAVDYQRINYSDVGSVGNSVARLFAGRPLGATDGPGFGWRDVSVVKLGTIVQLNEQLTLRTGVSHNRQPIPAEETFFNVLAPGVVEDHVTLGATWKIGSNNEISASVMHALDKTVNGRGSIPANFGGGEFNIRLAETSLGLGFARRF